MLARCPNCAAPVEAPDLAHCSYCGSTLPREEPAQGAAAAAPRPPSVAELLAAVERHPELAAWRAQPPSGLGPVLGLGAMAVFGVFFAVVALLMLAFFRSMGGAPLLFTLFPLFFVAAGLWMAIRAGSRAASFAAAPLERTPALIVGKRTHGSGGGHEAGARTRYYATLEGAGGARSECEVAARLWGEIAAGDFGLAFMRGGRLLDFRRVGSR